VALTEEKQLEKLTGTVERIVFCDESSGFTIFVLHTPAISTVVRGTTPLLKEGVSVDVYGSWTTHPKFGKQFFAQNCTVLIPTSTDGLIKYFGSGMVKGIGKVYGEKLVRTFGGDLIRVIEEEPQRLSSIEGIGPKRAVQIMNAWQEQREFGRVLMFLREKDISPAYALRIYKHYKHATLSVVQENPYKIAEDVWGIGFATADSIAQKMGIAADDPRRISAGILHTFTTATSSGHLYIEASDVISKTADILAIPPTSNEIPRILEILKTHGRIIAITHNNKIWLGLAKHLRIEQSISQSLLALKQYPRKRTFDLDAIARRLITVQPNTIALHEQQVRGIITALSHNVSIITGGPGTGKTTLVRSLLEILDAHNITYKLAAPTGRAAKRMMESTRRYATTIHRMLELDPQLMKFKYNKGNTLVADVFIIDETSMIDIFLAHALLNAIPQSAQVIFLGDIDQLPSVGPGNFFKDMIASEQVATTRLTEIFRQAKESLIILNAHRINHGEFPSTAIDVPPEKKDVIFIKEPSAENLYPYLKRLFEKELPKRKFTPQDVQILSPMNRGIAGTHALNHFMQKLLFPQPRPKVSFFGTNFCPGDRVMQLRNNYDKNVFNGDLGVIKSVDPENQSVVIEYTQGVDVAYEVDELGEITLAYATTIHKSQGSEYPVVVLPCFMQHFMLLQRNLLYTGFTRAQKLCILIGEPRAIAIAIKKTESGQRASFLQQLLLNPEFGNESYQ